MLINDVSRLTGLTKKAIEYDTLQGLVTPAILENGYRDYSEHDIDLLNKVCVLRKLDVTTDEIRSILADKTNTALQIVAVRKELDFQRDAMKRAMFESLSSGRSYSQISVELKAIDKNKTMLEKLLDAFPGYYGRFSCLHFARFLNEPVQTEMQQSAFDTIISFLDNIPPLNLPQRLEDYLIEATKHMGTKQISEAIENTKKSIENPDAFLADNKDILEQYLAYKQSDEYKGSCACEIMELMREFYSANGYYDVFIPAMKQLSNSYAEYHRQLEVANEKLLTKFPEAEKMT